MRFPRILILAILAACGDRVTDPPPSGGPLLTVDVPYCSGLEPTWVAFQDGDGAWTQARPGATGRHVAFRGSFASDRGAIAVVREFANGLTTLSIQYGIPPELAIVGDTNPAHCGPAVSKTLVGTVAGLDANDVAVMSAGFASREVVFPETGNTFELRGLIGGPQDILAARFARTDAGVELTRLILRRNPELPDGAAIPVLDFNSPEAFEPVVANVTLVGLGAATATSHTRLHTPSSESLLTFLTSAPTAAMRSFYALPEARLQPGDLQVLSASVNASAGTAARSATVYFRSPVDRPLTLGAPIGPPELSVVSSTPALRLRARFAAAPDYDRHTVIAFQQGEATFVSVAMTENYAILTGGVHDLTVPDLTGVSGFDPRWALRAGEAVLWTANRVGGTLGVGFNAVPRNGDTARTAVLTGEMTPH